MQLVLRVVEWPPGSDPTPLAAHFDEEGGMVGRSETALLSLPDPNRTVSRFHAHVSCKSGVYYLENMGSTNPTLVNGAALTSNHKFELATGDLIQIGGYVLVVERDVASAGSSKRAQARPQNQSGEEDSVHTRFVAADDLALLDEVMSASVVSTLPQPASMLQRELRQQFPSAPRHEPKTLPVLRPGVGVAASSAAITQDTQENADPLWQAFQEGIQLKIPAPQGLKPEFMHMLGAMMRSAVVGMRRLVGPIARSRSGNTLRVAPDDSRALIAALRPPVPGFLTGADAIDEVMETLEAQQAATRVALRVVVDQVLHRFDPEALEKRLLGPSGNSGLPVLRKAKLWELYVAKHRMLISEARENLNEALGRALATAADLDAARHEAETQKRNH